MALSRNIELDVTVQTIAADAGVVSTEQSTATYESCYTKVAFVSGTKELIKFSVETRLTDELTKTSTYSFTPSMGSDNFIRQAYMHLKTLPEFEGAVDC
jgi:ubiquinone biosynthesis protein COQ9